MSAAEANRKLQRGLLAKPQALLKNENKTRHAIYNIYQKEQDHAGLSYKDWPKIKKVSEKERHTRRHLLAHRLGQGEQHGFSLSIGFAKAASPGSPSAFFLHVIHNQHQWRHRDGSAEVSFTETHVTVPVNAMVSHEEHTALLLPCR